MEDIIDIIVTETTNLITITSSGSDEVIDVNIIDNREDIVLNVTPSVVEININSLVGNFGVNWGQIGGTLTNQTDLNTALGLKADLVGGLVPSSQLPSYVDDVVEVANYAALPATGVTGKIYVTIDTNYIYRWTGSVYVEIKDSSAVWGAITGTLSNQTDLQNALNAKFDDPTGDATQYIDGTGALQTFPVLASADKLILVVRNTSGATITKGTVVYINGANGNKPTIAKALATSDATSAQTLGLVQTNIANNSNGNVVLVGSVIDLDTSAFTEGQQLYLSGVTAGAYTATKTLAPTHLVYVGVIARAHPTQGVIEVKIQNGYELDEIHDVSIVSKANNDGLFYEASTDLWKNKSIATVLGYTPANGANYLPLAGGTMTGAIVGTTATFTNAGTGIGLGVTNSGSGGDGIKITHSAGRAFNILSSANGYGIIINNETIATSVPFTIQKQGATVISMTDTGGFTGATIDLSNTSASNALRITHTNTSYHAVSITATGGSALYATGSVTVIGTLTATGVVTAQAGLANGTGQGFTFGTTSGVLAITSDLSAYLLKTGGTLTNPYNNNLNIAQTSGSTTLGHLGQFSDSLYISNNYFFNGSQSYDDTSKANSSIELSTGSILFKTGVANTVPGTKLTIASTGAATFSSSVNVGNFLTVSGASTLLAPSSGKSIEMVYRLDGANDYAFIQAYDRTNSVFKRLDLNSAVSILANGNVGIGTTAPTYKFETLGTSVITAAFGRSDYGASNVMLIAMNGYRDIYKQAIGVVRTGDYDKGDMIFCLNGSANSTVVSASDERMRITSGGNVLIGATSSKADAAGKLQVTGGIHSSTGFYTTGVSQAVSALNTDYVIRAGAYSGLIVIRDNSNGGSGVWLADPNMGFIQIANNMPGAWTVSWNGSNTVIRKTSGSVPVNLGIAFYSNEFYG